MRDPARINRILSKIDLLWSEYYDMRLGQLLVCLVGRPSKGFDIFSEEDDRLEEELDKLLEQEGYHIRGGWSLDE